MWAVSPPQLEGAIAALAEEFSGVFAREAVADCVVGSYELLQPARIPDFLPLLAHRFARERLRAAARAEGRQEGQVPSVLFVCTHNAGRSQLAAALLMNLAGERIEVTSAGSRPGHAVAPEVVTALAEIDLEASALFPKPITDEVIRG
ncbi:MAG: low molecular weight phosphatase family protein, partial [Pseudonocardiaceae bacterium]